MKINLLVFVNPYIQRLQQLHFPHLTDILPGIFWVEKNDEILKIIWKQEIKHFINGAEEFSRKSTNMHHG
jgi:hypothetical protein